MPFNKATAGGGGLTIGTAATTLIIDLWWHTASANDALALAFIINIVAVWLSTYFTPHKNTVV
jgi:hypothetical protein